VPLTVSQGKGVMSPSVSYIDDESAFCSENMFTGLFGVHLMPDYLARLDDVEGRRKQAPTGHDETRAPSVLEQEP
jgi:hypothetical protein